MTRETLLDEKRSKADLTRRDVRRVDRRSSTLRGQKSSRDSKPGHTTPVSVWKASGALKQQPVRPLSTCCQQALAECAVSRYTLMFYKARSPHQRYFNPTQCHGNRSSSSSSRVDRRRAEAFSGKYDLLTQLDIGWNERNDQSCQRRCLAALTEWRTVVSEPIPCITFSQLISKMTNTNQCTCVRRYLNAYSACLHCLNVASIFRRQYENSLAVSARILKIYKLDYYCINRL